MPTSEKRSPDKNRDVIISKISKTKENNLEFFRVKPIASLLCSDDQLKLVIEVGK